MRTTIDPQMLEELVEATGARCALNRLRVDEEVLEAWMSARVQDAVRAYVERTLRK